MPHYDDLTLMMYEDRELGAEEAAQVRDHLLACFHCRTRLETMKDETCFISSLFGNHEKPLPPPPQLDLLTNAQINGIASLHKGYRRRIQWRCVAWTVGLLSVVTAHLLFWQRIWLDWFVSKIGTWNVWTPALWLRQSAYDLLGMQGAMIIALPLPFLLLIGVLLLLNTRYRSPVPGTALDNRGQKQ